MNRILMQHGSLNKLIYKKLNKYFVSYKDISYPVRMQSPPIMAMSVVSIPYVFDSVNQASLSTQ